MRNRSLLSKTFCTLFNQLTTLTYSAMFDIGCFQIIIILLILSALFLTHETSHCSNLKPMPERFRDLVLGSPVMPAIQKEAISQNILCARLCVCLFPPQGALGGLDFLLESSPPNYCFWVRCGATSICDGIFSVYVCPTGPSVLRNFKPGRDGTGFCEIPGSRDFSGRD